MLVVAIGIQNHYTGIYITMYLIQEVKYSKIHGFFHDSLHGIASMKNCDNSNFTRAAVSNLQGLQFAELPYVTT